MKIHEILTEKGQIRFDGKPLVKNYQAFEVREFIFIYYGSSRDKKSRNVAAALNEFIENFDLSDHGLMRQKDDINFSFRTCQVFYIPCERNF